MATAARWDRVTRVVVLAQTPDYSYAKVPHAGVVMALPVVGAVLHRLTTPGAVRLFGRFAFAPGFDPGAVLDDPLRLYRDHTRWHRRCTARCWPTGTSGWPRTHSTRRCARSAWRH